MNKIIFSDNTEMMLLNVVSLSTGDGLDLSQRYAYDASKKPQSIVFRRKNTALTATLRISFDVNLCAQNDVKLFDYISQISDNVGRRGELLFNGKPLGDFVIENAQFSCDCDVFTPFSIVNVSFALTEGYVRHEALNTMVSWR